MIRSITVDEFYLYAFLASGIRYGLLKGTDYGNELNERIPRFRANVGRIHELLLLFDRVVLTCDHGVTLGYALADAKLPLPFSVATRLVPLVKHDLVVPQIDSAPDRLEFLMNEFEEYLKITQLLESDLGLSIEVMESWASLDAIGEWIMKEIQKDPGKRDLGGNLTQDFEPAFGDCSLIRGYLRKKFPDLNHIPFRLFISYYKMYIYLPYDQIMMWLRRAPFYKSDTQMRSGFCFLLSNLFYCAQVVTHFLDCSERGSGVSALCLRASDSHRPKVQRSAVALLRVLLSHLEKEGLVCPRVRHLGDVIELRQDPRVRDFRTTLWRWVEALRSGEIDAARKVQSEVVKANKALKKIGEYQRLSDWIAYATVPAVIADALIGLPALSALLGLGGLGAAVAGKAYKKRAGWLLMLQGIEP